MDDRAKRFYAKVEKYGGWQQMPAEKFTPSSLTQVRVFTYAKTGRMKEAKRELDIFFDEYDGGTEARANLCAALGQVNSR